MSASQPKVDSSKASPLELADIQFWMDHPDLDLASAGLNDFECRILRNDAEVCLNLLKEAGRNPSKIIGAGTYGVVFTAFDSALNRPVAIKVLRPSAIVSDDAKAKFSVEAKALAQCEINGIVRLHGYEELSGIPFFTMQLIDGPNLSQKLPEFSSESTVTIACQLIVAICRTMQQMHDLGFIHRDLKPSNILLQRPGNTSSESIPGVPYIPVVTDFGFAKELAGLSDGSISSSTTIKGTVCYMAPEQAKAEKQSVSVRSDVYSLGVILYELLTQRCPFVAGSKADLICSIIRDEPIRPREHSPYLSRDLEAIVVKCLEKAPINRYPSAASLAADLENYLAGRQTVARPVGPIRRVALAAKRNKLLTGLWCAVAILAALASFGLWRERGLSSKLSIKNAAFEESMKQATASYRKFYQRAAEQNWDSPGKMSERLELHKEALEFFRWKAKASNYDEQSRHDLSIALHYVSNSQSTVGQVSAAAVSRRECLELLGQLISEFPDRDKYRFDRFMSLLLQGQVDGSQASDSWSKALIEIEELCIRNPRNSDYLDAKNALQMSIAQLLLYKTEFDRPSELVREVLANSKRLVEQNPEKFNYGKYVPQCYAILGQIAVSRGDHSEVINSFQQAIKAQLELSSHFDDKGPWLADEHQIRMRYIDALKSAQLYPELVDQCQGQLELLNSLFQWYPENRSYLITQAHVQLILSIAYQRLENSDKAVDFLAKAQATRRLVEFDLDLESARQYYESLLEEAINQASSSR